ncbi:MAG: hypothetical protein CMI96_04470 [Pelagibacteraceae bacterium]|nr:hypothetical protein [Pelagibacteraceae bacterium]|tara:strand:+ start:15498 stop:16397 length:900 start_codon:yes stop_codon:yes gene_type:complete
MKSIIIFGGAGYVGKHLILRFSKLGYKIIVPYQKSVNESKLRLLGTIGQIIPYYFQSLKDKKLLSLINNSSICINLKTSWSVKKQSYKDEIFNFNVELLSILKSSNTVKKYIYFSGLGVDQNLKSQRNIAILDTENYIKNNCSNSAIIRPSVILGGGDPFLSSLLKFFQISFFIPLFGGGSNKFQPVHIEDVCSLVIISAKDRDSKNKIFELGGPNIFTYKEFYNLIADTISKKRIFLPIPMKIARFFVGIIEKTFFSPITLEQLSLFEHNNVVSGSHLDFEHFKIEPQNISSTIRNSL